MRIRMNAAVVAAGWLASSFFGPSESAAAPRARATDLATASGEFRRAVHRVGAGLALQKSDIALAELKDVWFHLARMRDRSPFVRLRNELLEFSQEFGLDAAAAKLTGLECELDMLSKECDVAEARKHLDAARLAAKEKKGALMREEAAAVLDSLIGPRVGIPLADWVAELRRVQAALAAGPVTAKTAAEAAGSIIALEGEDVFWPAMEREALAAADQFVAAGVDLYIDGYYHEALDQLRRCEFPLRVAARACRNEARALRISQLLQQLMEGDRVLRGGDGGGYWWGNANLAAGFRILRDVRSKIVSLIESSGRQPTPQPPTPAVVSPGSRGQ